MERITRLHAHLRAGAPPPQTLDVHLSRRDVALPASVYDAVLTADAIAFVAELTATFAHDVALVRVTAGRLSS